jgi:alpha-N-arabinofuranosidase
MMSSCFKNATRLTISAIAITVTCAFAQNTLTLNVDEAKHKIKRTIYGGLLEDWGRDMYGGIYVGSTSSIPNTNGMRNDIIEGLKDINIGIMQFPGGCKAELYKWKNGVGDKNSRPGGDTTNGMGTDEYFQLCSIVGSEPFIQANCRSGTKAEMAAWLNYINEHFPGKLKYLGMGNEPWGGCYPGISVNEYLTEWYEPFNNAIPAVFKDKITRVGSYYTSMAETDTILRRLQGKMEGLSYHYYTTMNWAEGQKTNSFGFNEADYYNVLDLAYNIEGGINDVINRMNKYDPNYTYGLQPDEWGAWYNEIANMGKSYQQSSVRDALIAAQHLNIFNNNCRRIWMAQAAQPVNAIQSFFLTKNPPTTELIKTPTFYTYKLYRPHQNATMIPRTLNCGNISSKNLKALTASASIDSTKNVHISITNIDIANSQKLTITLNGYTFEKTSGEVITGPSFNSINDFGSEIVNIKPLPDANIVKNGNSGLTVTLPAHSVVMLTLSPPGTGIIKSAQNARKQKPKIVSLGREIVIEHKLAEKTPVTLSLFTADGKLAAPVYKTIVSSASKSLNWKPQTGITGNNVYIVSFSADGVSESQKVLLCK